MHAIKQRTQDGVNSNIQNTKASAKEILERLRLLRVEISKQAEEVNRKAHQYDMLRNLTPQEEKEADAFCNLQEVLEDQLDAIGTALGALLRFNVLK